jgi:cytochrome c peroxidase
LSLEGNISCNSCHNLNTYGVDNLPTSPGDKGELGGRNSPTTIHAALHSSQFWDGRAKDVEEQSGMPILNPVEHNIPSKSFLEKRLRNISKYQTMFAIAFPEMDQPITYDNLQEAIGAFERQLMPKSKFDKWLDGDKDALNAIQKEGLKLFIGNKCTTCHNGAALGGTMLQKFGVYADYWVHTQSKQIDKGLFEQTGKDNDKYMFKVSGLRNISKTAPYFHDGSVEDLSKAVQIMSRVQLNKKLREDDAKSIVAFLETLTADVDQEYKE